MALTTWTGISTVSRMKRFEAKTRGGDRVQAVIAPARWLSHASVASSRHWPLRALIYGTLLTTLTFVTATPNLFPNNSADNPLCGPPFSWVNRSRLLGQELPPTANAAQPAANAAQPAAHAAREVVGQPYIDAGAEPLGVLLLRNGNLFRGRISHFGDRYGVLLAAHTEVRFAAADVAFHGATLDDAYRFKRSQLPPGSVNARLDLAEWCLRYGLLRQAAEETTVALRLEPSHPRIPGLEKRIEASIRRPALSETGRAAAPRAEESASTVSSSRGTPAPAGVDSAAPRGRSADTPATLEQLEEISRELPAGTLERFTASIQPMLVNRCGANQCHGSAEDTGFRLVRLSLGASATRRYTLRNLHATLRHIDRSAPEESRLFTKATRPHGGAANAPLPTHDPAQAEQLRTWVQLAAQTRTAPSPARIAAGDSRPLQSMPARSPGTALGMASKPISPEDQAGPDLASGEETGSPPPGTAAASDKVGARDNASPTGHPFRPGNEPADGTRDGTPDEQREGAAGQPPAPARDPFDPEIFNRRYLTPKAR